MKENVMLLRDMIYKKKPSYGIVSYKRIRIYGPN